MVGPPIARLQSQLMATPPCTCHVLTTHLAGSHGRTYIYAVTVWDRSWDGWCLKRSLNTAIFTSSIRSHPPCPPRPHTFPHSSHCQFPRAHSKARQGGKVSLLFASPSQVLLLSSWMELILHVCNGSSVRLSRSPGGHCDPVGHCQAWTKGCVINGSTQPPVQVRCSKQVRHVFHFLLPHHKAQGYPLAAKEKPD